MTTCDVGIVGAGPAGAWAATQMARGGARVMLIDGSHPREKPCGGGLTGRALDVVREAIDVTGLAGVTIAGAVFEHLTARAPLRLPPGGPTPALTVCSRRGFDEAVLQSAVRAGATLVASRATDIQRHSGGWTIQTRSGPIECGWLVGADGPTSLVRRRVFRPFTRADLSLATGFFVRGRTADDIAIAFEDAPPGYLWSFPRPDHLAVGICAQADESDVASLQALARTWIEHRFGAESLLDRYSWPIPSLTEQALAREQPAGDRWMLLGDAAGLVDPITREGIYFALRSGELAAASLCGAGDAGRQYSQAVGGEIHDELRRGARLKARFFRPHFISLLLRAMNRSTPIRAVMADLVAGRQTYRGLRRRLLSTFELRLMVEMLRG